MDIEKRSQSQFFQRSGRKVATGGRSATYLSCHHRSRKPQTKIEMKRHAKCGGSVKTEITCPAGMKVERVECNEAVEITVDFQSHVGHEMEFGKLRLTTEEKTKLAGMLSQGKVPANDSQRSHSH